jgi:hypothetical protein
LSFFSWIDQLQICTEALSNNRQQAPTRLFRLKTVDPIRSSYEGWTIVDDVLDLTPDMNTELRSLYQSHILQSLAHRFVDKPERWAERLATNQRLYTNFERFCDVMNQRVEQGGFEKGSFLILEVIVSLLESAYLQDSVSSVFSGLVSRTKSKVVSGLMSHLGKALLVLYASADNRRSMAELIWTNSFVLKYPKACLDQNNDVVFLSSLCHHMFGMILPEKSSNEMVDVDVETTVAVERMVDMDDMMDPGALDREEEREAKDRQETEQREKVHLIILTPYRYRR